MLAAGFEPFPTVPYTTARAPWPGRCLVCGCEKDLAPSYWNVLNGQGACKECSRAKRANTRKRSLAADLHARAESLGFLPSIPYEQVGSRAPWPGVCLRCGQPISPWPMSLKNRHGACAYCAGKRVDPAVAFGKMVARGFIPSVEFPGSLQPWPGRCAKCNRRNAPTYSDVVSGGDGPCPSCARTGFDPSKPAFVYLMERTHAGRQEMQIGINQRPR